MREPRPIRAGRLLVARTDRLGDFILSLPLLSAIRRAAPETSITVLAPRYVLPVLENHPDADHTIAWSENADGAPRKEIEREVKKGKFDAAILLNPGTAIGWMLARAGIPYRTGPLARPASFLFLNRGLRQSRSTSGRHQTDLDAEFSRFVTGGLGVDVRPPRIYPTEEEKAAGAKELRAAGIHTGRPVAGIHAGSGDSALRWPEEYYIETGRLFASAGWEIALTGGPSEIDLADRLAEMIGENAHVVAGDRPLRSFFGLLANLDHFVAPSTGPLHAAAALGIPVSSPYPPLPSQSIRRWGPLGDHVTTLAPNVACPETIRCSGSACSHYPCMNQIEPGMLFEASRKFRDKVEERP